MKKCLSICLTVVLLLSTASLFCYAAPQVNWIITNPYDEVD